MIRTAHPDDAGALAAIYNHYIRHTIITFEEVEISAADMAARIAKVQDLRLPWLVIEQDEEILGYAYATPWRERSAYRFAVEASVYLHADALGRGHGRAIYSAVIDAVRQAGKHTVIGGVALPNAASVRLHESLGFSQVAQFREVGRKFDQLIDVGYWQRML